MANTQNQQYQPLSNQIYCLDQEQESQVSSTTEFFLNLFHGQNGKNIEDRDSFFGDIEQHNKNKDRHLNKNQMFTNMYGSSVRQQKQIGMIHVVIGILLCALIVFIYFDMKTEYSRQLASAKMMRAQCFKNFQQNQCLNPVEILQEQCKRLRECYHQQPSAKLTLVFAKVVTHMMRTVLEELGFIGLCVLILALVLIFWRSNRKGEKNSNELSNKVKIR